MWDSSMVQRPAPGKLQGHFQTRSREEFNKAWRKVPDQSKAKMRFQSFFMLMTVQPFFFASS
jgi:uncharacterized BrkB/YihY/UPF0761 family membrane protein